MDTLKIRSQPLVVLDVLEECGEGRFVQRDGQILPTVDSLLAPDELVVPELRQLSPECEVIVDQEAGPALAVELHEGETLIVARLLHVLQLIPVDRVMKYQVQRM